MTPGLTLDVARAVAQERLAAEGATVVLPGDVRRELVCVAVAGASKLGASGAWSLDQVRRGVSVTLPGDDGAIDALALVPAVGPVCAAAARAWGAGRPQVYLSPAAWDEPLSLVCTAAHEAVHVRQLYRASGAALGTLRWCIGYGGSPEVRAHAEGTAYTQDVALRVILGGESPAAAVAAVRRSLDGYGLEGADRVLAEASLGVAERTLAARAPVPGPCCEILRALAARGVEVPGWAL